MKSIFSLFIYVASVFTLQAQNAESKRPNIILLLADDMGIADAACYGFSKDVITPNLDAMAANGLQFNRFYAQAPVCSPTRGSYLTSRHPFRYGIFEANVGTLRPEEYTLAEALKEEGYQTAHFGKWHLGAVTEEPLDKLRMKYNPPSAHGFDTWFSTYSCVDTANPYGSDGDYRQSLSPYYENGQLVTEKLMGDDSRIIMNRALPYIEDKIGSRQPFFTVIWFHTPHKPVKAEEKYKKMYNHLDEKSQEYFGAITAMDEQIGRLRALLKEKDADSNTLLWFSSDNGAIKTESTGPYTAGKRHLYEGGVRVPGIVEWPNTIQKGRQTEMVSASVDFMPTVIELVRKKDMRSYLMDGISLAPLLEGKKQVREKPLFFQSHGSSVVMNQEYKALKIRTGAFSEGQAGKSKHALDKWMLFDMQKDAVEKVDISASFPEVVTELTSAYDVWAATCKESFFGKEYLDPNYSTEAKYRDNAGLMKKKSGKKKKKEGGKKKNKKNKSKKKNDEA